MHYDRRGIAVTSNSTTAVAHFDAAVRSFLAHRRDAADHVAAALAADPDLTIAHCFTGFALLLLGRSELFAPAREAAMRAETAIAQRGASLREIRLLAALQSWLGGEMERCATILGRALADQKLDALTFKLLHATQFMLGDTAGMRLSAESVREAWNPAIPEAGFILGCRAFALEETGALGAAEICARQALALEAEDVWAAHALAHIFESRRLPAAGIAWLQRYEPRLAGVNNFAQHVHWHEALFHLTAGNAGTALALYDGKIRTERTDDYRDIANAASLLWRLERQHVDVGSRWEELADLAQRRIGDGALVFAQLNYLLCLLATARGDAVAAFLAALERQADSHAGTQARIAARVGLPLARFLCHQGSGRAITGDGLQSIGGSNAQRALFAMILQGGSAGLGNSGNQPMPGSLAA